jgi:hypothetical protein
MPLHATPVLTRRLTANLRLIDPLLMNTNMSFLKDVTVHLGGAAGALDAIDTTRINKPYYAKALFARSDGRKEIQGWLARPRESGENESASGTNPEDFKFVVPDNWDAATNNVIWERKE